MVSILLFQEAVESTGLAPVGGLDSLLSAAASSQSVNTALQELTTSHIQVKKYSFFHCGFETGLISAVLDWYFYGII